MPKTLGVKLSFPVISIYDYFLDMIKTGSIRITKPVNMDVAISDPCFGYENGDDYWNAIRL